jgi:DNA replication and repair protein RecF
MAIAAPGSVGTERKLVKVNNGKQPRVTDLIGNFNAVLFSSVDLDIVRGDPEERRRFLNYEIGQVSPRYVLALGAYRRALEQRNRLLKDVRFGLVRADSLEAWTEQIVEHGAKVVERRRSYLEKLTAHAEEMQQELTGKQETLVLEYLSSFALTNGQTVTTVDPDPLDETRDSGSDPAIDGTEIAEAGSRYETDAPLPALTLPVADEVAQAFRRALAHVRRDELQRGTTLLGPQRDDLAFRVGANKEGGVDVKTYGSQGQQRTVALALRLAERRLIEEAVGEPPVVLLDDVLSDLDEARRSQIFTLALGGGQTFLTTTDLSAIPASVVEQAQVWNVTNGVVSRA